MQLVLVDWRSVIESIFPDTMFEIPSTKGVTEVAISGEVVEGDAKPLISTLTIKKKKKKICKLIFSI